MNSQIASTALALTFIFTVSIVSNRGLAQEPTRVVFSEAQKKEMEDILIENSKKINKGLPIMIDTETRLDSTLAIGMQMHYKGTMINLLSEQIDKNIFWKNMNEKLIKNYKSDNNMMLMMRAGLVCFYNYFDKDGFLIAQVRIDGKMCGIK
jgi:hypothetical protein